jgi:hypothetical protein
MNAKLAIPILLTVMTMLTLPSSVLASTQEGDLPTMQVLNGMNGPQEVPLKAIQDVNKNIEVQEDYSVDPSNVITIEKGKVFILMPDRGTITKVKAIDAQLNEIPLYFADNIIKADLPKGSYILSVILQTEDGKEYGFVTLLVVLAPAQIISETNIQNIINAFTTKNIDTTIIFEDENGDGSSNSDDDNNNPPPPDEDLSPCYFHPNDDPHCVPVDGQCPEDAPNMNEQGNCHPAGCPDGYSQLDDDETGTCYSDKNVIVCPGSNAKVLDRDDCAIYEPDEPIAPAESLANDTSDVESEDVIDDEEETPVNENGEPLDRFCGTDAEGNGVPCTSAEKEAGTLGDEPTITESEKVVQDIEDKEEDSDSDSGDGSNDDNDDDGNNGSDNDNDDNNDSDDDDNDSNGNDEDEDENNNDEDEDEDEDEE